MAEEKQNIESKAIDFECAIDKAGFGLYSYTITALTGLAIISFVCVVFSSTIIVPTSACELGTTSSQQGILAAVPVIGAMLGGVFWGYQADTRGRRSMLLVSIFGGAVFNLLASISINWIMLLIFQLIASLFASGTYSMSMSLLSESIPMAKRNLMVLLVSSIFILSQGLMAVLAIPIIPLSFSFFLPSLGIYWNSWRTVLVVYTIPGIVTAIWLLLMQESPKYMYVKGDTEGALRILRIIHRVNHLWSKEELQVKSLQNQNQHAGSAMKDQIVPLFRAPLLKYTVIMTVLFTLQIVGGTQVWLPTIANQFVRLLQSGEGSNLTVCGIMDSTVDTPIDVNATPCALNTTSLLIVLGVGALQSIFNIILSMVIDNVGRRNIVIGVTAVCGISGVLVNLVPNAIGSAVLFVVLLMGIVVLGIYTAIMVALFPTNLRALAIAFAMTFGRLSTFASIQILRALLEINCDAGLYIYGSIFAASAIVASLLPDDRRLQAPKPYSHPAKEGGNDSRTNL